MRMPKHGMDRAFFFLAAFAAVAFWVDAKVARKQSRTVAATLTGEKARAAVPVIVPARETQITAESANRIALAHMQQGSEGLDYWWVSTEKNAVFIESRECWSVHLEARPKARGERRSQPRVRMLASVLLTDVEVTRDGKISDQWSVINAW